MLFRSTCHLMEESRYPCGRGEQGDFLINTLDSIIQANSEIDKEHDTDLEFYDGVSPAVLHGKTTDLEDKQQAILNLSNGESIQYSTSNIDYP